MSKPKKQKAPKSEKDKVALASAMSKAGIAIQADHSRANAQDNRYDGRGKAAAQASANNAMAMRKASNEQRRRSGRVNVAAKHIADGEVSMSTIESRAGVTNLARKARGASDAARGGRNALSTMNAVSSIDGNKQRRRALASNQRGQAIMDGVAGAVSYGLEKKWENEDARKEKADYLDKNNLMDQSTMYDDVVNYDSDEGVYS